MFISSSHRVLRRVIFISELKSSDAADEFSWPYGVFLGVSVRTSYPWNPVESVES